MASLPLLLLLALATQLNPAPAPMAQNILASDLEATTGG